MMTGCMNSRNPGAKRLLPFPVRQETLSWQAFLSLHGPSHTSSAVGNPPYVARNI